MVIKRFKNKHLADFFEHGKTKGLPPTMVKRIARLLTGLDVATELAMFEGLPGARLHPLKGNRAGQWALSVNGPWRIVFKIDDDGQFIDVDLVEYHDE